MGKPVLIIDLLIDNMFFQRWLNICFKHLWSFLDHCQHSVDKWSGGADMQMSDL
jgi:hypothetical protein